MFICVSNRNALFFHSIKNMSSQISQILSNFKLFSESGETDQIHQTTLKYKLTLGFLAVVIVALVYFKREELSKVFAGLVDIDSIINNVWLRTHLTSAGELASTYVPEEFPLASTDSSIIGINTAIES